MEVHSYLQPEQMPGTTKRIQVSLNSRRNGSTLLGDNEDDTLG